MGLQLEEGMMLRYSLASAWSLSCSRLSSAIEIPDEELRNKPISKNEPERSPRLRHNACLGVYVGHHLVK
jgi:hypothetical protein